MKSKQGITPQNFWLDLLFQDTLIPERCDLVPESRSVTRGTLWLIVAIAGTMIMLLLGVSMSGAAAWARVIEDRGLSNERRITILEARFAANESKLDSIHEGQRDMREEQKEIKAMLKE